MEVATVAHVIDGDGFRLADGREVRYIGMDAPEMRNIYGEREPWAQEATDANARLVAGKQVRLAREVSDHDRYGRLLRACLRWRYWVNGEIVRLGSGNRTLYPAGSERKGAAGVPYNCRRNAQNAGCGGEGCQVSSVKYFYVRYFYVRYSCVRYSCVRYSCVRCSCVKCSRVRCSCVKCSRVRLSCDTWQRDT